MTLEQILTVYGPLGVMVLLAIYIIREQYNASKARDAVIKELNDKRLEDYKVILPTLQENTAATKITASALEDLSKLVQQLIQTSDMDRPNRRRT